MTLGEALDDPTSNDDYVAKLLASEARDKSLKYSALGLQAYLPRRPTERAPKPNTRFLKNILRDTDSHNAALKRKEEKEARERMWQLRGEKTPSSGGSERHRERDSSHRNRSPHHREKERSSKRKHLDDFSRSKRHRRQHEDNESDSGRERSSRSHRRHRGEDRRPEKSRDYIKSRKSSSRQQRDERSKSPVLLRSRSRSPEVSRRHRDDDRDFGRRKRDNGNNERLEERKDCSLDNDSDPLEDFVGPLPASSRRHKEASEAPTRGRGSYRLNTSTIDSHFAHDYDPKFDVEISENDDESSSKGVKRRQVAGLMTADDDWDMALEALRDRTNWKQKGEQRLRTAGFDESTVKRWKEDSAFSGNDTEGRIEDVKWAKKGEGREWDRGKVMNADGHYDVKAQW